MPKTNAELAQDVETLKQKQGGQEVRNARVDQILETLVSQTGEFKEAIRQQSEIIQVTIREFTQAIARLEERNTLADHLKPLMLGVLAFIVPSLITVVIYLLSIRK